VFLETIIPCQLIKGCPFESCFIYNFNEVVFYYEKRIRFFSGETKIVKFGGLPNFKKQINVDFAGIKLPKNLELKNVQ
jgi:hypothetical protein